MSYPTCSIASPDPENPVTATFYGCAYETRKHGDVGDVTRRDPMVCLRGNVRLNGVDYTLEATMRRQSTQWDAPPLRFWLLRAETQGGPTRKASETCWRWLRETVAAWLASEEAEPYLAGGEMTRLEEALGEAQSGVLAAREALDAARERVENARKERNTYQSAAGPLLQRLHRRYDCGERVDS